MSTDLSETAKAADQLKIILKETGDGLTLHFQQEWEKLKKLLSNETAFLEYWLEKAAKTLK